MFINAVSLFKIPSTLVSRQMDGISTAILNGSLNFVFRMPVLPIKKNYLLKSMVDTNPGEIIIFTTCL